MLAEMVFVVSHSRHAPWHGIPAALFVAIASAVVVLTLAWRRRQMKFDLQSARMWAEVDEILQEHEKRR